jgi:hypothetical protein
MVNARKPREIETRADETRTVTWKPPSVLPDPLPQDGWSFRWIRTSSLGQADNKNASMRLREGWEPVRAEDHPELMVMSDHNSEWAKRGAIEVGGLVLCKMPTENAQARQDFYSKKAEQQVESVDNAYLRENDPRMPMLKPERSTRVTFGRG